MLVTKLNQIIKANDIFDSVIRLATISTFFQGVNRKPSQYLILIINIEHAHIDKVINHRPHQNTYGF